MKKEGWQNRDLLVFNSSSSAKNLITFSDPGKLIAPGKPASRTRRNSKPDEAPSSQLELKDVYLGRLMDDSAWKPVATEENQVLLELSESESWSVHESEVADRSKWPHFLHILGSRVFHEQSLIDCEKDLRSWTQGRNGRPRRERGYLVNVQEYHSSSSSSSWSGLWLRFAKKHLWSSLHKFFKETENLIKNQTKIFVYLWLITKNTHGARQARCVTVRSRMSRPSSSQTQCSVWEVFKKTRKRLGKDN